MGKIHFKIAHQGVIRRFALERGQNDLIAALKGRVLEIIGAEEVELFWKDEDSLIVLENEDDLTAAMDYAETQNKLGCVVLETGEKKMRERGEEKKVKLVTADESKAAFGVAYSCSACKCYLASSNGGRFECMICDDFHLCADCLSMGAHDKHAFMWLRSSNTKVPLFDKTCGVVTSAPLVVEKEKVPEVEKMFEQMAVVEKNETAASNKAEKKERKKDDISPEEKRIEKMRREEKLRDLEYRKDKMENQKLRRAQETKPGHKTEQRRTVAWNYQVLSSDKSLQLIGPDANAIRPIKSWAASGLDQSLIDICRTRCNYSTVLPIQSLGIPAAMTGRDILAQADSGTGRSAAAVLPIVHEIRTSNRAMGEGRVQAIMVAPNRDLVVHLAEQTQRITSNLDGFRVVCSVGQSGYSSTVSELCGSGAHILISTVGRLRDHIMKGHIDLQFVRHFVLADVDRLMEDKNCMREMDAILENRSWPKKVQSVFFAEFIKPAVKAYAAGLLKENFLTITPVTDAAPNKIKQNFYETYGLVDRNAELKSMLQKEADECKQSGRAFRKTLVFVRDDEMVNYVQMYCSLNVNGVLSQGLTRYERRAAREEITRKFRTGEMPILFCTDACVRGFHVEGIEHVINFYMPSDGETYTLRIGKVSRGTVSSFVEAVTDSRIVPTIIQVVKADGQEVPQWMEFMAGSRAGRGFGREESPGRFQMESFHSSRRNVPRSNTVVTQNFYKVDGRADKNTELLNMMLNEVRAASERRFFRKTLLFVNQKGTVGELTALLSENIGVKIMGVTGDEGRVHREEATRKFRNGEIEIIIGTDCCVRGLDAEGIEHVINYDMPTEGETYNLRIGRARNGTASSFIQDNDSHILPTIIKIVKSAGQEVPHWMDCLAEGLVPFGGFGVNRGFGGNTGGRGGWGDCGFGQADPFFEYNGFGGSVSNETEKRGKGVFAKKNLETRETSARGTRNYRECGFGSDREESRREEPRQRDCGGYYQRHPQDTRRNDYGGGFGEYRGFGDVDDHNGYRIPDDRRFGDSRRDFGYGVFGVRRAERRFCEYDDDEYWSAEDADFGPRRRESSVERRIREERECNYPGNPRAVHPYHRKEMSAKRRENHRHQDPEREADYVMASQIPALMTMDVINELPYKNNRRDERDLELIVRKLDAYIHHLNKNIYSLKPHPRIFAHEDDVELIGNIAVDLAKHLSSLKEIVCAAKALGFNYHNNLEECARQLNNRIDYLREALQQNDGDREEYKKIAEKLRPILLTSKYTAHDKEPYGNWDDEFVGFMEADPLRDFAAPPRVASANPEKEGLFAPTPKRCVPAAKAAADVVAEEDSKPKDYNEALLQELIETDLFDKETFYDQMIKVCGVASDLREAIDMMVQ